MSCPCAELLVPRSMSWFRRKLLEYTLMIKFYRELLVSSLMSCFCREFLMPRLESWCPGVG